MPMPPRPGGVAIAQMVSLLMMFNGLEIDGFRFQALINIFQQQVTIHNALQAPAQIAAWLLCQVTEFVKCFSFQF